MLHCTLTSIFASLHSLLLGCIKFGHWYYLLSLGPFRRKISWHILTSVLLLVLVPFMYCDNKNDFNQTLNCHLNSNIWANKPVLYIVCPIMCSRTWCGRKTAFAKAMLFQWHMPYVIQSILSKYDLSMPEIYLILSYLMSGSDC